jgi:phosphodiesterase/alkaline phosphatase D-like protein
MTTEKGRRGRPATGQNTKVIRVPKDFDREKAVQVYYEWLPIIEEYRSLFAENPRAVRNEKLGKLLEELGLG